jgi:hypothetical protein
MASALRISPIPAVATALGAALIAFGPGDAPRVPSTVSPNVQLTSGDELIMMSGTGSPTVTSDQESLVAGAINDRYGTDFTPNVNIDPLSTPEGTYSGTFQDDEIDLLNDLSNYKGDNVTVFGVSQSGAAVGMAIHDIETGVFPTGASSVSGTGVTPLPSNFSAADLPQNIHWLALAPDSMPLHENAGGQFSYDPSGYSNWMWPHVDLFPTDAGNADVYVGMYDPVSDVPLYNAFTTPNDYTAYENSEVDGVTWVHGDYTKLTPQAIDYEISHATEFTINPTTGAVTIYPDQLGAPTDLTHFYLMPDVYDWGSNATFGAPGSDYDSLLPMLGADITYGNQASYESSLPYDTLEVDAGYDDSLHPFEYMIDNTWYTFYHDAVVPVADLPAGVAPEAVSWADFTGADGTLAYEIALGLVSPT